MKLYIRCGKGLSCASDECMGAREAYIYESVGPEYEGETVLGLEHACSYYHEKASLHRMDFHKAFDLNYLSIMAYRAMLEKLRINCVTLNTGEENVKFILPEFYV